MKIYILAQWDFEAEYEWILALSTNIEDVLPRDEEGYIKEFDLPEDGSLHLQLVGKGSFKLVDKQGNVVQDGVKLID